MWKKTCQYFFHSRHLFPPFSRVSSYQRHVPCLRDFMIFFCVDLCFLLFGKRKEKKRNFLKKSDMFAYFLLMRYMARKTMKEGFLPHEVSFIYFAQKKGVGVQSWRWLRLSCFLWWTMASSSLSKFQKRIFSFHKYIFCGHQK